MGLVRESLVESELGEVTLLLNGLLAWRGIASLPSYSAKARRTLPTKLLIVVPLTCLCTMLLRLGGLGGLAQIPWQKIKPVTSSNGLVVLDAVTRLACHKCLRSWASSSRRSAGQIILSRLTGTLALWTRSISIQLPRQARSLQEALVLMLVGVCCHCTLACSLVSGRLA